jgi:1,4-dihydroxy-6-naphthoate synthase
MKLTIGFSPCPNDTFIFDALVNGGLPAQGLEFEFFLEDVQTLNEWAIAGKLDITKLSYGVVPAVINEYQLLTSGSALGTGVGPVLIKHPLLFTTDMSQVTVAIPGENTTAHLLFKMAYPYISNKIFMRYDAIEDYVLSGKGAGVIIHENRFTYLQKGLEKIIDLGDFYTQLTGMPIPLGGIAARRTLPASIVQQVNILIKDSLTLSYQQYPTPSAYVKRHAQEMSEAVMRQHIDLYVNEYTRELGAAGKQAIVQLLQLEQSVLFGEQL